MRAEVKRLEVERDILKKAMGFFAALTKKSSSVSMNVAPMTIMEALCRTLDVPRSGYYSRAERPYKKCSVDFTAAATLEG